MVVLICFCFTKHPAERKILFYIIKYMKIYIPGSLCELGIIVPGLNIQRGTIYNHTDTDTDTEIVRHKDS